MKLFFSKSEQKLVKISLENSVLAGLRDKRKKVAKTMLLRHSRLELTLVVNAALDSVSKNAPNLANCGTDKHGLLF